jgi:hypothetical protein
MVDTGHRSENVAFDAVTCATVPILSEGGPAKWLKNKNLSNHLCDYEPGGREFESLRAHHLIKVLTGRSVPGPRFFLAAPFNRRVQNYVKAV